MTTNKEKKSPTSLDDVKFKDLRYYSPVYGDELLVLSSEEVCNLYAGLGQSDFTRAELADTIAVASLCRFLTKYDLNRIADNLLRRWNRQGLAAFGGGRFGNAVWRATLR